MSRRLISLLLVLVLAVSVVAFSGISASAATTANITVAGVNYTANIGDIVTYRLSFSYPTANLATYQIELPVNFTIFSGPSQSDLDNIFGENPDIGFYRYDTANARDVIGYVENYVSFTGMNCAQPVVVMELHFKVLKAGSTSLYANLRDVSDVQDHDIINYKGTVLDNTFSYAESLSVEPGAVKLSGVVKSSINKTDTVTIKLFESGSSEPIATVTGTGDSTPFSFDVSRFATYTISLNKPNHVERVYTITVNDVDVQENNLRVCPLGDVDISGKVNIKDVNALYKHTQENPLISEPDKEYKMKCANVNQDKKVNIKDVNRLYEHVQGDKPLW